MTDADRLAGLRRRVALTGSFGVGKVAFPGGHLELGESWDVCARREVMEETGISLAEPTRHVATTNDVMIDDGKHYVTIFMLAEAPEDAEPQNLEPHKCKGWSWVSYAELRALPAQRPPPQRPHLA